MPLYSIDGPGGKTYKIEGPENATRDQVIQAIQNELGSNQSFIEEEEEEEQSTLGTMADIGQGIGAGLMNLPQGIAELGALGIDIAFDTNTSQGTTEFFEDAKETLNLTPEGTAGKVAEGITTFGTAFIPVAGWLSRANTVAKGGKVLANSSKFMKTAEKFGGSAVGKKLINNRLKLAAGTALGSGMADVLVVPSTFNTLSDSFDALPDFLKTEEDTKLTGSDEAWRRFRNKMRFGVEGVGLGAAGEALFPVVGLAARAPAYIPGVPTAARLIGNGFDKVGEKLGANQFLKKYFTASGLTPRDLYEGIEGVKDFSKATTRDAAKRFIAFDNAAKKVVGRTKLFGKGKDGIQKAHDDLYKYLTGAIDEGTMTKAHGSGVTSAAKNMRDQVDGLTNVFMREIENSGLEAPAKQALLKQFSDQQGQYLRRLYEVHLRPEQFVMNTKLYDESILDVTRKIMSDTPKMSLDEASNQGKLIVDKALGKNVVDYGFTPEQYIKAQSKVFKTKPFGEKPLFKISESMLKDRSKYLDESANLRALLKEIKDPKELYLRTVDEMSQTLSANQLYKQFSAQNKINFNQAVDKIKNQGRPLVVAGKEILKDGSEDNFLKSFGYTRLGDVTDELNITDAQKVFGGKYGALTGDFVPNEVYDSLTVAARATNPLQEALAISLQAKGLSQMTKTVLNPLSQIRNFHSGIFMVGANGNIARDMSIFESSRLTVGRIKDMGDAEFRETFNMLQKTGLVDQNYVVNEFRALLDEGADLKVAGKIADLSKRSIDKIPFARAALKGAQNVYSGTDNYWKTVGYLGEKAKYSAAFRRSGLDPDNLGAITDDLVNAGLAPRSSEFSRGIDFMDLMSTDIVKATMPTYSRVPELVKTIRRIPVVGNFMAFPAEIIRTTTNITRQGLKELGFRADDIVPTLIKKETDRLTAAKKPIDMTVIEATAKKQAAALQKQIRAIGAKRLSNYAAMAYVAPVAAQKAAMGALDFTQEQLDALELEAPPWMKGHTLMPISHTPGKAEYVDLSYMMPYDFMAAPVRAAMQAYSETGEVTDSQAKQVMEAGKIALLKLMEPFASEALLSERIADVFYRDGVTRSGSRFIQEGESDGDKLKKGFNHIIAGFSPGVLDMFYQERGGKFQPGRLTKAITGTPGGYGETFTPAEEAASMLTGFREMEADLNNTFYYKGAEYKGNRSGLLREFKKVAGRNDSTNESVINAFQEANRDLLTQQSRLFAHINAARTLGLSNAEIRRSLSKQARMGRREITFAMNGKFLPFTISRDLIKQIRQETTMLGQPRVIETLPLLELRNITNQLRNIDLNPEERIQEEPVETNPFLVPSNQENNNPFLVPSNETPVSQNNVAPSVLSTGTVNKDNTVSATRVLAGTNPLTQLIAERQSANT